jgi:DNA-binding NtrC family response regulator
MSALLRIVLVDDSPDDRALVIRELRREFPALEVVHIIDNNGFSKVLAEATFDVVITDSRVHWTTGLEVLHRVKTSMPTCPVLMFTGTGSEDIAVAAMKGGLDDYVLKSPDHLARLPEAVRVALETTRQRQQEALNQREKLATMERWLAGVAHELNNPLSVILGHAAILHQVLQDTPNVEQAREIVQAAERCARMVNSFWALVQQRPAAVQTGPVTIVEPGAVTGAGAPVMVRGARILVVDDEPGIAGVLTEVLQLDRHVVETVGNGDAALAKLALGGYDLILSDIRMPELDGPALYREVECRYPDLLRRFIFLTGDVMSPETSQFLLQTAVPCLSKPFTLETVRQVVQRALTETAAR